MNNLIKITKKTGILGMIGSFLILFLNSKEKIGKEFLNIFQVIVIYNVFIAGKD